MIARATSAPVATSIPCRPGDEFTSITYSPSDNSSGSLSPDPATAADQQDVVDQVEQFAGGLDLTLLNVTTSWPDGSNEPGDRVTVETTYTYNPIFDIFYFFSFGMSSSSTMDIRH